MFQEFPPSWKNRLAEACGAQAHRALSGRKPAAAGSPSCCIGAATRSAGCLGGRGPRRWSAAARAGSLSVGGRCSPVGPSSASWPSPRPGVCVANLHVSTSCPPQSESCLTKRAPSPSPCSEPLVFGGDFNARPRRAPSSTSSSVLASPCAPPLRIASATCWSAASRSSSIQRPGRPKPGTGSIHRPQDSALPAIGSSLLLDSVIDCKLLHGGAESPRRAERPGVPRGARRASHLALSGSRRSSTTP